MCFVLSVTLNCWLMAITSTLLLLFLTSHVLLVDGYNYCNNEKLCAPGITHFMCDPESIIDDKSRETKFLAHVPMTFKMRKLILDAHNKYRNELAGGTVQGINKKTFPKAVRMRDLLWEGELAYIARVHAQQCAFKHDKCRDTPRFPNSGQNIGSYSGAEKDKISEFILRMLKTMFDEKDKVKDPDAAAAKCCQGQLHETGHFTVIINDMVSRVGCAVSYCEKCGAPHCYYLTCNYDMTNMEGKLTYLVGNQSASKCDYWETEKSDEYPNLCANTGKFFHDPPNY